MLVDKKNDLRRDIRRQSSEICKILRQGYFEAIPPLETPNTKPFYGFIENEVIRESLGPFPEYILPTRPCLNCIKGYCTSCFFSKLPTNNSIADRLKSSLITQTKYIIDSCDDILFRYQKFRPKDHLKNFDVVFCYATNGSFFSDYETDQSGRYHSLKLLVDFFEYNKLKPLMYLETCSKDFIKAYKDGELNSILPYLHKLNATILFGLESSCDFTRNYIWNKNLPIEIFENSVEIAKKTGLNQGAFVFAGFFSMTETEIIEDVKETLAYLKSLNVMPVLMFPNLKSFTISHLLYKYGRYRLIDPRTVVDLYYYLHNLFNSSKSPDRDSWLTGDLWGGPPASNIDIFNSTYKISCDHCSELIVKSCMEFRVTKDVYALKAKLTELNNCPNNCDEKYKKFIHHQNIEQTRPIIDRVKHDLSCSKLHLDDYLKIEIYGLR